jgi:hypothetical protein
MKGRGGAGFVQEKALPLEFMRVPMSGVMRDMAELGKPKNSFETVYC